MHEGKAKENHKGACPHRTEGSAGNLKLDQKLAVSQCNAELCTRCCSHAYS